MQKKIIALAIVSAFAAPVAMADTTVYGSLDMGLRNGAVPMTMALQAYNSNRLGFKSTEDMGDGMKANVVMESALLAPNTDNGMGNPFGRQFTIGVAGGFGSIDAGYNYTASFRNIQSYDPLSYKFLSVAGAKNANFKDRANGIYYANKMGDVSLNVDFYTSNATTSTVGTAGGGYAAGVIYAAGDLNVGVAYTSANEASITNASTATKVGDTTNMSAGAGYKFGDAKVSVGYATEDVQSTAANKTTETNMWVGGNYKMGSINLLAAYYTKANHSTTTPKDATTNKMVVGATYALSKNTTAYFDYDTLGTTSATGVTASSNGMSVGVATVF